VPYLPRIKETRLTANGRLISAVTVTIAAALTWKDAHTSPLVLWLIVAWCTFAAVMAWRANRSWNPHTPRIAPIIDLATALALIASTGAADSPYFPVILTGLWEASMLYGRRGLLPMILTAIGSYVAIGILNGPSDVRFFIMRTGVLVMVSVAIFFRRRFESRVRRDVEKLAAWPRVSGKDRDAAIRELLTRAADALQTPRAALVWQENEGAFFLAESNGDSFEIEEDEPQEIVTGDATQLSSFADTSLLSPSFVERLHPRSLIAARLSSETATGWLFLLDHQSTDADDLALAEIVARLVSSGLDQANVVEVMRRSSAAQERVHLARDLHDGLLQSLTGLGLHAQTARQLAVRDPQAAEQRLAMIVEQLASEQSTLREFVDELRPERTAPREPPRERLSRLAADLSRQWNMTIDLDAAPAIDALPESVASSVISLVAESLANAGKHAQASHVHATLLADNGWVRLNVEDDGRGFPFHGRFDLGELESMNRGPSSIKARVAQLGGEMTLESSPKGSRLGIRVRALR